MKQSTVAVFAIVLIGFAACKKQDDCPKPPVTQTRCDLMQSKVSGATDMAPNTSQFRKEYDNATGKVRKVVAGLYGLYFEDSIALLLHYNGDHVYITSEQKPSDTVLIATFDGAKRLVKMQIGNVDESFRGWYDTLTVFNYNAGRLSVLTRHLDSDIRFNLYLTYDQSGNVVRIGDNSDDPNNGIFYTYDLTIKATAQFYPDAFGTDYYSNATYLADFLGWLPDLDGVNKRTAYKNIYDDPTDNEPGYVYSQRQLTDHIYDGDGKLLSYTVADGQITYTNHWHCSEAKMPN